MKPLLLLAALSFLLPLTRAAQTARPDAEGFVPMFNGRDLSGWTNINCTPETWSVRDGVIHCTGEPVGCLRTERQYENFILEVEWRHLKRSGNSGVFIWGTAINAPGVPFHRGIEVQILDHGYAEDFERKTGKKSDSFTTNGDVFAIHGATMKYIGKTNGRRSFPIEDRSKGAPEWNHYRIVANNGSLRLHVNGKEVSGGDESNYRKGYLALESEGSPVEFRNIRIKELPSSGAGPDVTAPADPGWRALYNAVDLRGWRTSGATEAAWTNSGGRLTVKAAAGADADLRTSAEYGRAEFVIDYQPPKSGPTEATIIVCDSPVALTGATAGKFSRFVVTSDGQRISVRRDDAPAREVALRPGAPAKGPLGLRPAAGGGVFMNLHVRDI